MVATYPPLRILGQAKRTFGIALWERGESNSRIECTRSLLSYAPMIHFFHRRISPAFKYPGGLLGSLNKLCYLIWKFTKEWRRPRRNH